MADFKSYWDKLKRYTKILGEALQRTGGEPETNLYDLVARREKDKKTTKTKK